MASTQPTTNPLRGRYILIGLDLIRAGIVKGMVVREDTQAPISNLIPSEERWLTSRAVVRAAAACGIPLDMAAVPASQILALVLQDPRAKVRKTEDAIVHACGGENPVNRAYAKEQIHLLETNYGVAYTTKAA